MLNPNVDFAVYRKKTRRKKGILALTGVLTFRLSWFQSLKKLRLDIKPYARVQGLSASSEESERNFKAVPPRHTIAKGCRVWWETARFI